MSIGITRLNGSVEWISKKEINRRRHIKMIKHKMIKSEYKNYGNYSRSYYAYLTPVEVITLLDEGIRSSQMNSYVEEYYRMKIKNGISGCRIWWFGAKDWEKYLNN